MSRPTHLIFNPVAGQGDPIQDLDYIRRVLEPKLDLTVWRTSPDQDADVLAQQALAAGSQLIIACGGDGTLSAAATALVGSDVPFGVISRGTANAFANALGIPDTLEAACDTLLNGLERRVDSALCHQGDQRRAMILLAGIGFEAATVEMADRASKDRFGMMAYVLSGLRQLRQIKMFDAQIETDDQVINVRASAITVANAAPSTSILAHGPAGVIPDDGLLDITIISCEGFSSGILAGYHLLQSALTGNAAEREDIGYFRAKRVTISTDPAQLVVMDGEILETAPISIECQPQSLTIMVPRTTQAVVEEKLEGLPGLTIQLKVDDQKTDDQKTDKQQSEPIQPFHSGQS